MYNHISFGLENTKHMDRDDLINTFVPTEDYYRLLEPMNHVVLGSRGSGKTALARMLSHDHMAKFENEHTKELISSKKFIGIYVATNVAWVGALDNKPWAANKKDLELNFQWRFNLSVCDAFLCTAKSCIDEYVNDEIERIKSERSFIQALVNAWELDSGCKSINTLREQLHDLEFRQEQNIARSRVLGEDVTGPATASAFDTDIFSPIKVAIRKLSTALDLPDSCKWVVCIDEAEFLNIDYQKIINTQMRAHSGSPNLIYKVITMPYKHLTLDTNSGVPLNLGDDFEYIYIDRDPVIDKHKAYDFAESLFKKRAQHSYPDLPEETRSLIGFFGVSCLLDPKSSDWSDSSIEMGLLKQYATPKTINRANNLRQSSPSEFKNQISRKLHGLLMLKDAKTRTVGRKITGIYSGASLIVRCGDGNPRRLIRIFKHLIKGIDSSDLPLKESTQEQRLRSFSAAVLEQIMSEPDVGPIMHDFLEKIGSHIAERLHSERISTDQISSIKVTKSISKKHWEAIKCATGLGLMFPNRTQHSPDSLPEKDGVFHLAYVLAPHFFIMPRRGSSGALVTFLSPKKKNVPVYPSLFGDD
ncbi:hypothetical protein [Mariprofundus ferrooxydans]|uniref:ORC-CDC6 family AAA ATPase n=1 Tax=Mariprofundus ferrooxydans TaxID=314344 RepID=UPI0014322A5F|nr:hypothetical protein [Mariprofundus ferrooxydans]